MFTIRNNRLVYAPDAGGGGDDFLSEMDQVAQGYQQDQGTPAPANQQDDQGGAAGGEATAPAPAPAATPTVPDPSRVADDMPYRDAKQLRDEMAAARAAYKPIEEALGSLPDEDRQTILTALPNLHEDDRAALIQSMALLNSNDPADREEVADFFARAAEHIRGQQEAAAPERDPDLFADDPLDRPMTRREFMAEQARIEAEQAQDALVDSILDEARGLGYDPDSTDPAVAGDFAALCEIARRTDGDLRKAHEVVTARRQAVIDEYLASKTADAGRSLAPSGGASSTQERTLDTLDDAEAAMRARMDAQLGPR